MNFATLFPDLKLALDAISESGPILAIKSSSFAMPLILCSHVLALAVLAGAILMPGLRLMGIGMTSVSASTIEKTLRPWLIGALVILAISGTVMVLVNPMRALFTPAFFTKVFAFVPALILSLGVVRSIASRDGVITDNARIFAGIAAALWVATIWIFGTSYYAAPGPFHIVCVGWVIVMAFGSNRTRIVLGAISAVLILGLTIAAFSGVYNALNEYDLTMEIDRWSLRFIALVVAFFLVWEFTRQRPDTPAPIPNRLIGLLTILSWFTVAAAGRWIGLGGGGT